jgi:predicted DCC family thiol-disulfide oxidoreductase YuxK
MVRHLRRPWPMLAAGRVIPRPVRDWLYDRIARNRYRLFGRRDSCLVPSADIADRFLT